MDPAAFYGAREPSTNLLGSWVLGPGQGSTSLVLFEPNEALGFCVTENFQLGV